MRQWRMIKLRDGGVQPSLSVLFSRMLSAKLLRRLQFDLLWPAGKLAPQGVSPPPPVRRNPAHPRLGGVDSRDAAVLINSQQILRPRKPGGFPTPEDRGKVGGTSTTTRGRLFRVPVPLPPASHPFAPVETPGLGLPRLLSSLTLDHEASHPSIRSATAAATAW